MGPLNLQLFGSFRATRDGGEQVLTSKKAQALLAFLAIPAGKGHTRERLASLLWGDMSEERARHNLRQCLSAIRRELGEDAVVADADRVRLGPTVEVDVDAFEREGSVDVAAVLLDSLHVHESPFDHWLEGERRRLRNLACDRWAHEAARAARAGDLERAIDITQRRVAMTPSREEAHLELIRLLARAGRRSAALEQYDVCVRALRRDLDAAPGPATEVLVLQIRQGAFEACAQEPGQRASGSPDLPDRPSIAVLPFRVVPAAADTEYLGLGIAEELTVALSRFESLFVISATAMRHFAGRDDDLAEVGRELGVHFALTGTIRQAGERIRVTAELIEIGSETSVWAERYDRESRDVFAVQDEITETLVATIVGRMQAARLDRARRAPTGSLVAYDCLLRGKDHHHRWTTDDSQLAISMFERAIELDPEFALAHAWLACSLGQRNYFEPDPTWMSRAIELIRHAHSLDEGEPECYRMFAAYYLAQHEFDKAEHNQSRAYQLNPNDDRIVCQMGEVATYCGRPGEGVALVQRAMRLNPYHPDNYWLDLGRAQLHAGQPAAALASLCRIGNPNVRQLAYMTAAAQLAGREAEAAALREQVLASDPDFRAAEFTARLPYRHAADRELLAGALVAAGLPEGVRP